MHKLINLIFVIFYVALSCAEDFTNGLSPPSNARELNENLTEITQAVSQLLKANEKLLKKVTYLEGKLNEAHHRINSLDSDIKFFIPTVEHGEVYWTIDDWNNAVETDFEGLSYSFEAGHSIGTPSTWSFFLTQVNGSLSANLQLQSEEYNKGALFAGFTVFLLNSEGTSIRNVTFPSTRNVLAVEGKTLSIHNLVSLSAIENPENKILRNNSLGIRFRFDLPRKGHKLYKSLDTNEVTRDRQTVEFEVNNLIEKIDKENVENGTSGSRIAYTRFHLFHPWSMNTNWILNLYEDMDKSILLTLSLEDSVEEFGWQELFASFEIEILNAGKALVYNQAPLNDYMKSNVVLQGVISSQKLDQLTQENLKNATFVFKLYLTVFGKQSMYYVDFN